MNKKNIHMLSRGIIINQNHILLCQTSSFSQNFYFIPGGHVEYGEGAEQTLSRELLEETGYPSTIKRFLGCVEYQFKADNPICHTHEYNLIFEVEAPGLTIEKPLKSLENHIDFFWIPLSKLTSIDLRPEPLQKLIPEWLQSNDNKAFNSKML